MGGDEFLLRRAITDAIFGDDAMRQELMRVGLERGCLLVRDARRGAIDRYWPAFRQHLVSAMRAIVPRELLHGRSTPITLDGPYRTRITREIQRTGMAVYEDSIRETRITLANSLATAPTVPQHLAAGPFSDWQLERRSAIETACDLMPISEDVSPEAFESSKRAFDRFNRRQGD